MADYNCSACEELREESTNFVVNGITDTECTSLKNDTGLNPSAGHDDCTDLNNINDCLVGNMDNEVEAYDVCDWKTFMHKFIPNVWTTFKAIICAICGLWGIVKKLQCLVNYALIGESYAFTQDQFELGTGISFRSDLHSAPFSLVVKGSTYRFNGSISVDLTNSHWGSIGTAAPGGINTSDGNWTVAILKINKAEHPSLQHLYSAVGSTTNIGCVLCTTIAYDGDDPNNNTFPGQWGYQSGEVTVPPGYLYLRLAISNAVIWGTSGNEAHITLNTTGLTGTNTNGVEC